MVMIPQAGPQADPPDVQRGGRRASDHGDFAPDRRRDPLREGPRTDRRRTDRRGREAGPTKPIKQAAGLEKLLVLTVVLVIVVVAGIVFAEYTISYTHFIAHRLSTH